MFSYLLVLFLVMFFVLYEKKVLGRKAIIAPLLLLIALPTLRSNRVGTDSGTYTAAYIQKYYPYEYGFHKDIEYGYQLIDSLILSFSYNYVWLFLITSIIVIPAYLFTIKKISINYLYSILIFITFGFYTFFFNGLRQGIAMAICFFGLPYLIQKRVICYSLVVFIASLFHMSALIMLPLYFLVNSKIKIELKFLACLITSTLTSQILIGYFAQSNARYEHYTQEAEQAGGYITLAFYFLIGLLVYVTGYKIRNEDIMFNKLEQMLLCGLALVLPVALLGTDPSGPQRIMYYFVSSVIFLIPYILRKYNNLYISILFLIFSVIYFILITMRFSNLYPYVTNPIFEIF